MKQKLTLSQLKDVRVSQQYLLQAVGRLSVINLPKARQLQAKLLAIDTALSKWVYASHIVKGPHDTDAIEDAEED